MANKLLVIPNLNNKLMCEYFLHLAPPMEKFLSELLTTTYECHNGKQVLELQLVDYTTTMLINLTCAITLVSTGLRPTEFKDKYMEEHHCTDTRAVGIYYFKITKRGRFE